MPNLHSKSGGHTEMYLTVITSNPKEQAPNLYWITKRRPTIAELEEWLSNSLPVFREDEASATETSFAARCERLDLWIYEAPADRHGNVEPEPRFTWMIRDVTPS